MSRFVVVSRREFLRVAPAAGAGLVLGFRLSEMPRDGARAEAASPGAAQGPASPREGAAGFSPNVFSCVSTARRSCSRTSSG